MSKPPTRRPKLYIVNLQVSAFCTGLEGFGLNGRRRAARRTPGQGAPPARRETPAATGLVSLLQWTPKDDLAALKLHGRCDDVLRLLMAELGLEIPRYDR